MRDVAIGLLIGIVTVVVLSSAHSLYERYECLYNQNGVYIYSHKHKTCVTHAYIENKRIYFERK